MSNTGVFGLSGYNDKNLEGLIPDKTREAFREYGYFGGGSVGATRVSTVDRIDYSNDTATASVRGPLSSARNAFSATGNTNFGYCIGGAIPAITSVVDRINYSNDTSTTRVANNFGYNHGSTGNINYGYIGGGGPSPITESKVDRLDYSNDLSSALTRGSLTLARFRLSATGNSNFGYFIGGHIVSTIDRVNYANDSTTASIRGPLSLTRSSTASTGNRDFGYVAGSLHVPSSVTYSYVDRINYSNDLITPIQRAFLSTNKGQGSFTGNSNFGYFGGGYAPGGNTYSTVDRIDYSNDTQTVSIRGSSSIARSSHGATSSASFGGSPISQYGVFAKPFGYFGGGFPNTSAIDRIDYTNDTSQITTRNNLSLIRYSLAATGNQNFGYFGGGFLPATVSTIDRIDYSNDASAVLTRGPLSIARFGLSSTGNQNFGYFGGGTIPGGSPTYSQIDRIDYSNDTSTASSKSNLTLGRFYLSATGTQNFGYFGGGRNLSSVPADYSKIERIDYSNDNTIALVRSQFLTTRILFAATGNSNFGYFGGGTAVISTVDRLDYSSDTTTASTRGPLSLGRRNLTATGNFNFGYFGGGNNSPSPGITVSTVDRVDYANDTATASVRGPLSSARYASAATSPTAFGGATDFQATSTFFDIQSMRIIEDTTNASVKKRALGSYGYFGGGAIPASTILSSTNRIDYSNDTVTASVRGNLSLARRFVGGAGNSNFGYFAGGNTPPPSPSLYSTIDRIDYSNDSSNALIRTPLLGIGYHSGFGNQLYGYFASSQGLTTISRVDFSNDTSVSLRNILQRSAYYRTATGNNNYGYIQEGLNTSVSPIVTTSLIERVQYSNDNQKTLIRGPLSIAKRGSGATGNSNFCYYAGGINGSIPATYSTIDRIDYANDTATTSVRGPLLVAASSINEGTGNSNFGYFSGFTFPVQGSGSGVNRVNYSNDTATASARGPLSSTRYVAGASTNARFS